MLYHQRQWPIFDGFPLKSDHMQSAVAADRRRSLPRIMLCAFYVLIACLVLLGTPSQAQNTSINLATQGRNADFSAFPFTRPVTVGTSLPASCQVGQLFFSTTVSAGSNLYGCTAPNIWTTLSSSSNPAPQVTLTPGERKFRESNGWVDQRTAKHNPLQYGQFLSGDH